MDGHIYYRLFYIPILLISIYGCSSYERFRYMTEDFSIPSKVFRVNFNQSWQAVIQVMKSYDLAYQNQDAGLIRTKWIDNTSEMNFSDSFASQDAVKGAKFKITISVIKEFRMGMEATKISIYKRQLVEQDFLQGWKEMPSDGIQEQTLLYRIERIIRIDQALRAIEQERDTLLRQKAEQE